MSAHRLIERLEGHADLHPESAEVIGDAVELIEELFSHLAPLAAALPPTIRQNRTQFFSDEFGLMVNRPFPVDRR